MAKDQVMSRVTSKLQLWILNERRKRECAHDEFANLLDLVLSDHKQTHTHTQIED